MRVAALLTASDLLTIQLFSVYRAMKIRDTWYIQSMLAGVPKIIVGYHQDGLLQRTETLLVEDLAHGASYMQDRLDRVYQVLSSLRAFCLRGDNAGGDHGHRVWHVKVRGPKYEMHIRELDKAEVSSLNEGDEREAGDFACVVRA